MTSLNQDIEEISAGIRAGRFPNEAAVSHGIVHRLLSALGWPAWDTQVIWPEYDLEGRRVDFALCHPPAKPQIFVEVKQVGKSEGGERQLFEYAFHKGVPVAILTDGREWNFFLPGEPGAYGERRVYKLDLLEREVRESAERLERYLQYTAVCSGAALAAAREDYRNVARAREVQDTLPDAWRKLVEEEDDFLIELVADRVESLCGYKPDPDTVARFLTENIFLRQVSSAPSAAPPPSTRSAAPTAARTAPSLSLPAVGFLFQGRSATCRSAREVLASVLEAFADSDPTFLQRFSTLPKHGRTRRYIALNRDDLYPDRPDLVEEHSHRLRSGYWLGTNVSRRAIERIISMACEVAGLRYGVDVRVKLE